MQINQLYICIIWSSPELSRKLRRHTRSCIIGRSHSRHVFSLSLERVILLSHLSPPRRYIREEAQEASREESLCDTRTTTTMPPLLCCSARRRSPGLVKRLVASRADLGLPLYSRWRKGSLERLWELLYRDGILDGGFGLGLLPFAFKYSTYRHQNKSI